MGPDGRIARPRRRPRARRITASSAAAAASGSAAARLALYYVGLDASVVRSPLALRPSTCDAQEGDEIAIERHDFDLLTDQPVSFPLASSSVRPNDRPGDLVAPDPDSIRDLPPLQTHIRVGRKAKAERVPVRLSAKVTEVGTVEVWCNSRTDDRRWRLQIQLRGSSERPKAAIPIVDPSVATVVIEQSELDAGIAAIRTAFDRARVSPRSGSPPRLVKRLEECLDALAADSLAPLGPAGGLGPAARTSPRRPEQVPAGTSRGLVQPRRLLPPARRRLPARRVADQGPLADVPSGGEARQGARSAGPNGGSCGGGSPRGAEQGPSRGDPPTDLAPCSSPQGRPAGKGGRPRPEPHEMMAEIWRCAGVARTPGGGGQGAPRRRVPR